MFDQNALIQEAPKLRKFALRLTRNTSDADDLLQNTLIRAIEKAELFQDGTDLFKWTSKMMFNLFVSEYRRKTKHETQYDPESYIDACSVMPNQESVMDLKTVGMAMTMLSQEHREILLMVCVRGMRYEEAAQQLGVPVGTVRSRLSRSREALQRLLEKSSLTELEQSAKTFLPHSQMQAQLAHAVGQ